MNSDQDLFDCCEPDELSWLCAAGVKFTKDMDVIFANSSSLVIEKLEEWNSNVDRIEEKNAIKSLDKYLRDEDYLKKWLIPQEKSLLSLVHILIRIPKLQKCIISYLCLFLSQTELYNPTESMRNIVNQIISVFSFIPKIVDQTFFENSVFESLDHIHETFAPLIIQNLHHFFDSSDTIVQKLIDVMTKMPKYATDALSTLECFQMSDNSREMVRDKVMQEMLSASNTDELPSIMRFLVSSTDESNADSTVSNFRRYLVVPPNQSRTDSLSDTYVFLVIQLKSALQFNQTFCNAFIQELCNCKELFILDIWVLFCLFGIPSRRAKAEQLITKLSENVLTSSKVVEAILGFTKALESIMSICTEIISWALNCANSKVIQIGSTLAFVLFNEINNISIQQDIIASLIRQINIGNDINKQNAVKILIKLSDESLKKLSFHLPLLQGILYSYDLLPLDIFKQAINVVVAATFANDNSNSEDGNQLHIFYTKLITSQKREIRDVGIITAAAIINRLVSFTNIKIDYICTLFDTIVVSISDDILGTNLFFTQIRLNSKRSQEFNEYLIKWLTKGLDSIVVKRKNDSEEWHSLDDKGEYSIDCLSAVLSISQKRTLSINKARKLANERNNAFVYTQAGLQLLLDCHHELGNNIMKEMGNYFRMPIILYDREKPDLSNSQKMQCLLLAHGWLCELINYLGEYGNEEAFDRMNTRIEVEKDLYACISNEKKFIHPLYGEMFPRSAAFIKKISDSPDKPGMFVSKYRGYFTPPRKEYLELLTITSFEDKEIIYRIIEDYIYLFNPSKDSLYYTPKIEEYDMKLLKYISNKMLKHFHKGKSQYDNLIFERIITIINMQIQLPIYKDKTKFADLLNSISDKSDRKAAFAHFSSLITQSMPNKIQLMLVVLLSNLLHCGPPQRNIMDTYQDEINVLCNKCKQLLSSPNALNRAGVKQILPIFIEHNPESLEIIGNIIKNDLVPEVFSGKEQDEFLSLTPDTFSIYLQNCFSLINKKIGEFQKKFKNDKGLMLDEQNILIIMDRLLLLSKYTKILTKNMNNPSIPDAIIKINVLYSSSWMESCIALFDFLKDAYQVDGQKVTKFLKNLQSIYMNLQKVINNIRKNMPELQKNIPRLLKALSQFSCNIDLVFKNVFSDDTQTYQEE